MSEALATSKAACNSSNISHNVGVSDSVPASVMSEAQRDQVRSYGCATDIAELDKAAPTATGLAGPDSLTDQDVQISSVTNLPTLTGPTVVAQPAEVASSESGFVEPSSSCTSVPPLQPSCQSLLPYVNSCAQYAQQVAIWCGKGQPNANESEDTPTPLCNSKRELVQRWLTRPARRQALASEAQEFSHCEGQNEYNIWYGRHLTDRYSRPSHTDRDAAPYRCDPELDAGYTAADTQPGNSEAYFCAFFAKGCCTKGSECRYKHRIPTLEDECTLEWSRDIFGRERHRDHRDDMGGAGSFNHECRTLFVGGLQIDPLEEDGIQNLEKFLWESFGAWGDVQAVRVIPKKLIGFVTFAYRVQAEFAKVAMADQNFGKHGSLLSVKWAHQDGNAKRKNTNEEQSKKLKLEGIKGAAPQKQPEQKEEDVVRQTLNSYCSAWQAYWAALCMEGKPDNDGPLNQQHAMPLADWSTYSQSLGMLVGQENSCGFGDAGVQFQSKEDNAENPDAQRLLNVLNRVEGLSTADFLKAGVMESSNL